MHTKMARDVRVGDRCRVHNGDTDKNEVWRVEYIEKWSPPWWLRWWWDDMVCFHYVVETGKSNPFSRSIWWHVTDKIGDWID